MYKPALILALLFLTACANRQQHFTPLVMQDNTRSVVYLYRPDAFANRFTTPNILLNERFQFKLKNNHYDYFLVDKGKHRIQLELPDRFSGKQQIDLHIEPARHYFVQLSTSTQFEMHQPYSRRFDLQLIPQKQALQQLSQLKANKKQAIKKVSYDSPEASKPEADSFSISKTRNPFSN